jgi:hypothetical protein
MGNPLTKTEPKRQLLLLVYSQYEYAKKLLCVDLGEIQSDQELFKAIRSEWQKVRGGLWFLKPLRTVRSITFVKFELWSGNLVDVRVENVLPTLDQKHEYDFGQLEDTPLISDSYLALLFNKPGRAKDSGCLAQVPKKRHEPHVQEIAWGLSLKEGWDLPVVARVVVVLWAVMALILWRVFEFDLRLIVFVGLVMYGFGESVLGLALRY